MKTKTQNLPAIFFICMFAAVPFLTAEEPQYRLSINSYLDFGHLVNGFDPEAANGEGGKMDMFSLNRGNVTIKPQITLGEHFDVLVGLTGLLWWPYNPESAIPQERVGRVKPMVPLARGKWKFGDPGGIHGFLQAGTFPYKYNMEAKNLGEYLYRAGTYPGFLFTTEGWLLMNRAGHYAHGLHLQLKHLEGKLTHNFSMFMEMVYYPIGDFSPGYDFSLKLPFIELGGGIVLNHFIPVRPSLLTVENDRNKFARVLPDTSASPRWRPSEVHQFEAIPLNEIGNGVEPGFIDTLGEYTHKGVKMMGRVTLNLNSLLSEKSRNPDDLKFFVEAAVLGWDDKPFYYENRSQRMPVMFGLNIPTFKLLDLLSLQLEYYSSPFNSIEDFNQSSLPIWSLGSAADDYVDSLDVTEDAKLGIYSDRNDDQVVDATDSLSALKALANWESAAYDHNDDWKWSLYAKKKINKLLTVYGQVASDHLRLMDHNFRSSPQPLISNPKEWYYLLRLEFGIN